VAITEKYVTADASGSGDGSSGSPWTFAQAVAGATAGTRVNVKKGTYSRTTTEDIPTADGTITQPIIWRGYNSTIGDLDGAGRAVTGELVTTNFPVISYTGGYLSFSSSDYTIVQCLKVTNNDNHWTLRIGLYGTVINCRVENASTGTSASAIYATSARVQVINCDAALTAGSGGTASIFLAASNYYSTIYGCRCTGPAIGILIDGTTQYGFDIIANTIADVGGVGIDVGDCNTTGVPIRIIGNTIYGCGGAGIRGPNAALTHPCIYLDNHITDCGEYGIDSAYKATAEIFGIFAFNRFRDNSSGDIDGYDDYALAAFAHVTTDSGDATSDYVDAANGDLRLKSTAAAIGKGSGINRDIGAQNHSDVADGVTLIKRVKRVR
jgi:hypothetical protein